MRVERLLATAFSLGCLLTLPGCGDSRQVDSRFLVESFKAKNPGFSIRKYNETSFIDGTVPARTVGFAEDGRLRATMGCYDWVYSMPGDIAETESSMCIYFVYGPKDGGGRIWWDGDVNWLRGLMTEHDFQSR